MHSAFQRSFSLAAYTLVILGSLTLAFTLSVSLWDQPITTVDSTIKTVAVSVRKLPDYHHRHSDKALRGVKNDVGFMLLDLSVDLRSLLVNRNWNVKQLFLFATVEYETPNNKLNKIVVWDKIIQPGENAFLDYKNIRLKYSFQDDGNGMRGNNASLSLTCNIVPVVGSFRNVVSKGIHEFSFPKEYTISSKKM